MRRIGILGGTFNPVHNAHIMLAEQAYREYQLDCVYFMPSKHPPHKPNNNIASDEDRMEMLRAALGNSDHLKISDLELKRDGTTYTSDTLTILHEQYPDVKFYFIIGGDSLHKFTTWHEPQEILKRAALICTGRSEYDEAAAAADIRHICETYTSETCKPEILYMRTEPSDISSSHIRASAACSQSLEGMVKPEVADHITAHGLYGAHGFDDIRARLQSVLSEKRYRHVLGVADTCFRLAYLHHEDPVRAYTAGLLHDCVKYKSGEELIQLAHASGKRVSAIEKRIPNELLHSKVGAIVARQEYGITDEGILSAIYYHTTGRARMSTLELIVYLADVIEPGRTMAFTPSLDEIRTIADTDLNKAVFLCLKNITEYLSEGKELCTTTLTAYRYYEKLIGRRKNNG